MTVESSFEEGVRGAPKKIVRGIPCFDDSGYFYGEMSREEILELTDKAASIGWRNTALGHRNAFVRATMTSPSRSLFLSILPVREGERILDAGAGWGILSAQIAKGFPRARVYATDKALERLFFAAQIREQERLENMHILQCDITDPPFERGFFDVVIMMGVFEWLGASVRTYPPKTAQARGLSAIHDIMRPGGRLLIGIENRIGYDYFLGHHDHSNLAFTSLMPRRVAGLYTKLRKKEPYRVYTYSRGGYQKLLKQAGFDSVTFYAALPDYRFPKRICDTHKVKEIMQNARSRRLARILPRGTIGALAPSYYIVAEKPR
jgi:SAM-dependent methyltransferase